MKRLYSLLAFAIGGAALAWLLSHADWQAIGHIFRTVSPAGIAVLLSIYPVAIWLDVLAWRPWFTEQRSGIRWITQLWKAQMIADAVLYLTPFGAAGSEAAKALILNRNHRITYTDATASLINLQIILAVAQVPFVAVGLWIIARRNVLPAVWEKGLAMAFAAITIFMVLLLVAVHRRWMRTLPAMLGRNGSGERLRQIVSGLETVEHQIASLLHDRLRFALAVGFAFANWLCFAAEMWLMARVLGRPISFADAWAIEALVSLARAATFFIPAHLGAQDGATAFAFRAFYADPTLGIAVALLRRGRELFWSLAALPMGLWSIRKG